MSNKGKDMTRIEEATNKIVEVIDIVKDVPKNESILAIGLDMVEWADKTMIDKVCKWLEELFTESDENPHVVSYQFDSIQEMIEDLRKTMEQ